jgi:chromosome segregation ATPase
MQAGREIGPLLIGLSLMVLLSGCLAPEEQVGTIYPDGALSGSAGNSVDQQGSSVARRFEDAAPQSRTAVESAVALLEKHAELSKQATELEKRNRGLMAENQQCKDQVTTLEAELKQARKELNEANDLLVDMRIELNNWKADILGFRDEMREAEVAQLEALLRILKILGGEVTVESTQADRTEDTTTATTSPRGPGQAKSQGTSELGEPNG